MLARHRPPSGAARAAEAGGRAVAPPEAAPAPDASRRRLLAGAALAALLPLRAARAAAAAAPPGGAAAARAATAAAGVADLRAAATAAFARRDFPAAVAALDALVEGAPGDATWREMRATALVDGKAFERALPDFDAALRALPPAPSTARARVLSGRALAREGLSDWAGAIADYEAALAEAKESGEDVDDPFVLNALGNCRASLGEYARARGDYLRAANVFQRARGAQASQRERLQGAVSAFSNAALMLAVSDAAAAEAETRRLLRRAPGNVDQHAALAALLWARGERGEAEEEWQYACERVSTGCVRYKDDDWVRRIRRWPPPMADKLKGFLSLARQ
jgi:tetratricopeptide (TPR) repeat protein